MWNIEGLEKLQRQKSQNSTCYKVHLSRAFVLLLWTWQDKPYSNRPRLQQPSHHLSAPYTDQSSTAIRKTEENVRSYLKSQQLMQQCLQEHQNDSGASTSTLATQVFRAEVLSEDLPLKSKCSLSCSTTIIIVFKIVYQNLKRICTSLSYTDSENSYFVTWLSAQTLSTFVFTK